MTVFQKLARSARWSLRMIGGFLRGWTYLLGTLCLLALLSVGIPLVFPITRAQLSLDQTVVTQACETLPIANYWYRETGSVEPPVSTIFDPRPLAYNADRVANEFAQYAALASNTYHEIGAGPFDPLKIGKGWIHKERRVRFGGLLLDAYVKAGDTDTPTLIAIVFRGTDGFGAIDDLVSNASWVFGAINPWDQYRLAREEVIALRIKAIQERWIRSDRHAFVAVGHSLGGGLAKHSAQGFPCTAAVAIDGSFVPNASQYELPYRSQTIDLFEDKDWLTRAAHRLTPARPQDISVFYQYYQMNSREGAEDQHDVSFMAKAFGRIVVDCLLYRTASCKLLPDERSGHTIEEFPGATVYCDANMRPSDFSREECAKLRKLLADMPPSRAG